MKYKEFKNTIKYWGEVYGYKTELEIESDCIWVELEGKNCMGTVCLINKSKRFVVDLMWETYSNLSENVKWHLFDIVTEFAATPIDDREYEEREDKKDNLDVIINRLEVIQTNAEDVMNWTILEIQERSWNLRNTLEDIIIDLEEYKEKQELPYEITDMQGMFAINNTDIPF